MEQIVNMQEHTQDILHEIKLEALGEELDMLVQSQFDNIKQVRQYAIEYARKNKFAISTLRSGERQLVLVCKHSGQYRGKKPNLKNVQLNVTDQSHLQFIVPPSAPEEEQTTENGSKSEKQTQKRTRSKTTQKISCPFEIRAKPSEGKWVIYKIVPKHNHPMASDVIVYAQHRKLDDQTKHVIVKLMKAGSTNSMVLDYLNLKGITNVVKKDIANIRQSIGMDLTADKPSSQTTTTVYQDQLHPVNALQEQQ